MIALANADAFLFDVDGTLVLSEDPNTGAGDADVLPGAREVLQTLRARATPFACFTNGTGQTPARVAAKLRRAGLDVADTDMLTPASIAAEHIRSDFPDASVLAFGTDGLLAPLAAAGIRLAPLEQAEQVRVVLIGADPDFTYEKLTAACRAVWSGARLLVTSMAPYFAARGGRMPSTSGAIAAGIRHVTGAEPTVVGKPSDLVIAVSARRLGVRPAALVVVGDDVRLETRMARAAGAPAVLVLSGTSKREDVADLPAELQPDLVIPTVGDLLPLLRGS